MSERSIEQAVGVTREGVVVKKGSPIVPLLLGVLTLLIFLAWGVDYRHEYVTESTGGTAAATAGESAAGGAKAATSDSAGAMIGQTARAIMSDIRTFFALQIKTIGVLALCALIPGISGLIHRRAFWRWFLAAFGILFLLNSMLSANGVGEVGGALKDKLNIQYEFWLGVETLLILLLFAYGLRRCSVAAIDDRSKRNNIILAAVLVVSAIAWGYLVSGVLFRFGGAAVLLLVAFSVLFQSLAAAKRSAVGGKNIVMCLDGTWNQPGTKDFGHLAETNVFKIFRMLKETKSDSRDTYNASQCKQYQDAEQRVRQIGFYYHGVGNTVENSELGQLLGGAFGMGANAIVERAYLDVVRVYEPGDRIFIFGFSRGAAIARLLAGVIGRRDIARSLWTLRVFGQHWPVWRSAAKIDEDNPVTVEVLGCWDTVGAFGVSKNILGIPFQRIDLLKDLTVSLCVKRAYHMVALDETRDSFVPTLMDPDPTSPERVMEVWFSGNHANVGGGYSTDRLSDVTLDFLLRQLSSGYAWRDEMQPGKDESWGLYLSAVSKGHRGQDDASGAAVINPDPRGQLRHATGPMYAHAPRKLPTHAVIHDSVFDRMRDALPVYAPQSLFDHNDDLLKKRGDIDTEVKRLVDTHSIEEDESKRILDWSNQHMSLRKWTKYLDSKLPDGSELKDKLRPSKELANAGGGA